MRENGAIELSISAGKAGKVDRLSISKKLGNEGFPNTDVDIEVLLSELKYDEVF